MIRVLSLGAGIQSTVLALMSARGDLPKLDCAIFADTGDEKRGTYRHLAWLETVLPFPLIRVQRAPGSLSQSTLDHYAGLPSGLPFTPPFFYAGGMLPKFCSKEWKTRAVIAELRRQLDLAPKQRGPKTIAVEQWIGYSRERVEIMRMAPSEVPWIKNVWPLIDLGMTRGSCIKWLTDRQYQPPPRSACVHCGYQSDGEFKEMKDNPADDDFPRAIGFDEAVRPGGNGTTGPLYVHRSARPLRDVVLDAQGDLWANDCGGSCGT